MGKSPKSPKSRTSRYYFKAVLGFSSTYTSRLCNRPYIYLKLEVGLELRAAPCNYHAIETHVHSCNFCNNAPINDLFRDSEVPKRGDAKSPIPRARRRVDNKIDLDRVRIVTPTSFDCLWTKSCHEIRGSPLTLQEQSNTVITKSWEYNYREMMTVCPIGIAMTLDCSWKGLPLANRVLETVYHDAIESTFAAASFCNSAPICLNEEMPKAPFPGPGDA